MDAIEDLTEDTFEARREPAGPDCGRLLGGLGACPASVVLRRACGLRSAFYASDGPAASRHSGVTV